MIPPLFPFQVEDVERALKWKDVYLGQEMGLGKSRIALELMERNTESHPVRALTCCPGGLKGVWQGEAETWKPHFDTYVVQNKEDAAGIAKAIQTSKDILIICSYDFTFQIPILRQLQSTNWTSIAFEEAHHLSSMTSLRSRACLKNLFPKAAHAIFISGSIKRNKTVDIFPVAHTIAPAVFSSYNKFVSDYCSIEETGRGGIVRDGNKAQSEALGRLLKQTFFIHRVKEDVIDQFPKNLRQIVRLRSDAVDSWRNQAAVKDFALEAQYLIQMNRAPAEGSGFQEVMQEFGLIKAPLVADYSAALKEEGVRHQVIFCWYRSTVDAVTEELQRRGLTTITLKGGDPKKHEKIAQFQAGEADCFVTSFAGAEGVTLTRANYCIMAELSFVLKDNQQAPDRIHRIGQTETCYTKFILLDNQIDDAIYNGYVAKRWVESKILGAEA